MEQLYIIQGIVISGMKRGKSLGFPTANVALTQNIPEGIYASHVSIEGKTYIAATFIGAAKTFHEEDKKAESFILDFNGDIYGKEITITLYKKVRENMQFTSGEALVKQMQQDILAVRAFFNRSS